MWPLIPSGNVSPLLICASFCDKNGNLAHSHRFLLQRKRKEADKTLEQCLPEEFKATWKNSSKSS